ncbi:hypothetical protein [Psychrobacter celer]
MTVNKEVYSDGRSGMSGLYPMIQGTPNAERLLAALVRIITIMAVKL